MMDVHRDEKEEVQDRMKRERERGRYACRSGWRKMAKVR